MTPPGLKWRLEMEHSVYNAVVEFICLTILVASSLCITAFGTEQWGRHGYEVARKPPTIPICILEQLHVSYGAKL